LNDALIADFEARYGSRPQLAFAPGRVNLIGDHIDYCGGSVLPMPIEQGTLVAAAVNDLGLIRAVSLNTSQDLCFAPDHPGEYPRGHWGRFVIGCLAVLKDRQPEMTGFDLLVAGDIPAAGLSSSASLSLGLLLAIRTLYRIELSAMEMALAAQRIEHEFIGVNCGLMDQAVIALGEPDAALLFDCAELEGRAVPIDSTSISILVADSGVPRTLAGSAYNERRATLAAVATALGLPEDRLARTLTHEPQLKDPLLLARARHVYSEQQRVIAATAAIGSHDWEALGDALTASHQSLARDYEVSCPELDALVDAFVSQPGCFGARMTGAGFGGAVVAAVDPDSETACRDAVRSHYARTTGRSTAIFRARSTGGARLVG
jgi:galactokinase